MWDALEKYQPYADADGHGETWRVMCEERTEDAVGAAWAEWTAAKAAYAASAAWAAAWAAYSSDRAIERIERAIKEREPVPSNIAPVSNDDGQAQKMDAQHSEIEQLKAERDALTDVVHRSGFRRCDIAACNCGSWHQVEGWPQRYREIQEATNDDYANGETLLQRVERICAERDALRDALRQADAYIRHPDYDWDDGFSRDVSKLLAAREVKP
jgi:cell division protein FtsB